MAQACPRCGAMTRNRQSCRGPAMPNGRCRMHGGAATGPRSDDGRKRLSDARMRHGRYSAEMLELRRIIAEDMRLTRLLAKLGEE